MSNHTNRKKEPSECPAKPGCGWDEERTSKGCKNTYGDYPGGSLSYTSHQTKSLAGIHETASDHDITRRYRYRQAVINAMHVTISWESNIKKEGPKF